MGGARGPGEATSPDAHLAVRRPSSWSTSSRGGSDLACVPRLSRGGSQLWGCLGPGGDGGPKSDSFLTGKLGVAWALCSARGGPGRHQLGGPGSPGSVEIQTPSRLVSEPSFLFRGAGPTGTLARGHVPGSRAFPETLSRIPEPGGASTPWSSLTAPLTRSPGCHPSFHAGPRAKAVPALGNAHDAGSDAAPRLRCVGRGCPRGPQEGTAGLGCGGGALPHAQPPARLLGRQELVLPFCK